MKRKKELIVILSSLLVIVLSVSVAYFTTKILGTEKDISVTSADLKVIFTSGSGTINGTNIEPGWTSGENTFTVKNESNGTYKYNIIIKDLVNTFVTEGFLQYKITSTDGGYNMTDFEDVPKSSTKTDTTLAENISIEKGTTHTYKIIINYNNSDEVDQSADMGKLLSGKIFIEESTFKGGTLSEAMMYYNPVVSTRSDFSTPFTTNTANTLYKATENGTDVYYFAGQDTTSTPINNWVKFGKNSSNQDLYWRIIRTNADGSIRLLYHGISTTSTDAYIGESEFNTNDDSPKYVGYMYGDDDSTLDGIRANTNNSTIKASIDNWYKNNLTSYTNYLSNDAVYCNDRELASDATYSTSSSSSFEFKSYARLATNKTPTYDCTNDNDKFTVDASSGNGKLTYPIALMTADEIAYAGGVVYKNAPMWYYTNSSFESSTGTKWWWLLSSFYWDSGDAGSWYVHGSDIPGYLSSGYVNTWNAVRPVVSLKSCVQWKSGDGSASNPYEIVENGGC